MSDEWRRVPAASVARIEIGGTPAREQPRFWADQDNGHAWASIADLNSEVVVETTEYISDLGVRSSNVKLVPAGTPIMSFKLTIGRTSLAGRDLYTNEAIAAFFADPAQVDRRFLLHALPGAARSVIADVAIKGATLNKKSLSSMQLSLPPIGEQRRIREILDALDDQIRLSGQVVEKLRTARAALRCTLYCDESGVNWGSGWPLKPLGSVVARIDSGKSPDCPDLPAAPGQRGVLKVSAVGRDHFHPMENKVVPSHVHIAPSSEVRQGDVLMTRANTPDLVGMICLVDRAFVGRLVLSDKTWRINPGKSLDPSFLVEALRATPSRRYIENVATGTSGSMKNFSQAALMKMQVPVPDQCDQRRIAECMAETTARIDAEEEAINKLRMTKTGVLSDLFSGRVRVPNGVIS
jgi:type I restriction enzyme S subunit